jgi:hypothetical protein
MRTVILVPRREGVPERDSAWLKCKERWQTIFPDIEIFEGHHNEGLFNRAKALNMASQAAGDWDMAIIIDSDIFIAEEQVREGLQRAAESGLVTWPFTQWKGLTQTGTGVMMTQLVGWTSDQDIEELVEKTNPVSWSCCIIMPRSAWDTIGGFDERFEGWGFEDMAFQSAAVGLVGHDRMAGAVYHLWHPRSPGLGQGGLTPAAIFNARLGRRYMVAVRRDYGMTDRLTYTDAAEMERDIANLKRDDAKYSMAARRLKLGDWDNWWPTLEELTGSSKDYAVQERIRDTQVTIIVHTDGRREFIEKSIPSLEAAILGNVVKRAIYDDSGDPAYKAWLREKFEPLGYYVVGPDNRVGYTKSMSLMWEYLTNRCTSRWVFLAEDDFTYDVPVDLTKMSNILRRHPHLRQLALLRHPYYPRELEAGSIIKEHPEDYEAKTDGEDRWLEHRLYFTANPSLFERSLTSREPWPVGVASSERVYTDRLNKDPNSRMAYLGHGEEVVTHIGSYRAGKDY